MAPRPRFTGLAPRIGPNRADHLRRHGPEDGRHQRERAGPEITGGQRDRKQTGQRHNLPMPGISMNRLKQAETTRPHSHEVNQHTKCGRNRAWN